MIVSGGVGPPTYITNTQLISRIVAERPCRRCVSLGKQDGCYDIDHKKRGRPKLKPNNSSRATTSYTTASEFMRHSSFTMTTLPPTAAQTTLQGTSSPVVTVRMIFFLLLSRTILPMVLCLGIFVHGDMLCACIR